MSSSLRKLPGERAWGQVNRRDERQRRLSRWAWSAFVVGIVLAALAIGGYADYGRFGQQ